MSFSSFIFCRRCLKADTSRDAGLTTPEDIRRFDDICYGPDKKNNLLDVYMPRDIKLPAPVIVSVHGGGWVYGNKDIYQFYCMDLAMRGFIVVNFTYRLAPRHIFPAAVEDTNLVFDWIMKNAEEYGFDTKNIFALGDSAGAQILAIYASILTNSDYAAEYSFSVPDDLVIKAMALNCGMYAVENAGRISFYRDFLKENGSPEELHVLSAANFVTEKYPPCFIMTANYDYLKDQAPYMVDALKQNGVRHVYKVYGDEKEKLYHVFHCNIRSQHAKAANDDECGFFREFVSP